MLYLSQCEVQVESNRLYIAPIQLNIAVNMLFELIFNDTLLGNSALKTA